MRLQVSVTLIILGLLGLGCRASLDCNLISPKSPGLRLKRHLFCEYDSTVRPVTDKNKAINVTISMAITGMDFVDRTSSFIVHAMVRMAWKDEHLAWSQDEFDKIQSITVKSDEIWVPDFSIYNSADMEAAQVSLTTSCSLTYDGQVLCVPTLKFNTQCETDYAYWPYDAHVCSIRMGSWTHTGEQISFDPDRDYVDMHDLVEHKEWQIANASMRKHNPKFDCCPNDTFPTIITEFDIRRHSPMLRAVFVTPAVVLMIITLTTLWLDSRSIERTSLSAVNFICHMLCIYDLHWLLPPNGSSPPHILLFYRDSLILATFTMIITTVLRKVHAAKIAPPGWIAMTVSYVANNRAGRFFLLDNAEGSGKDLVGDEEGVSDTATSTPAAGRNAESWRKLVLIVEWFSFFVALFVYVLLIFLHVPMKEYTPVRSTK